MRLIPPNVSVVCADLDKHPLRSAPSQTGEQLGENFVRSGSIKLLYSQPRTSEECAPLWLVNPKKKKMYICFQNLSSDSKRLEIL